MMGEREGNTMDKIPSLQGKNGEEQREIVLVMQLTFLSNGLSKDISAREEDKVGEKCLV